MEGVTRRLILDTGSNVSILQPGVSKSDVRVTAVRPYEVTGKSLDIKGHQLVSVRCNGSEIDHTFLVCSLPTDAAGLLGCDFLEKVCAVINFERGKMLLTDDTATSRARAEPSNRPEVFTVFTWGKEGPSPQPNWRQTKQTDERLSANTARSLARVEQSACQSLELPSRHSIKVTESRNSTYLTLTNSSGQELTLPKATVLEVEEEASEPLIDRINARSETSANEPTKSPRKRNNKVRYDKRQEYNLDRKHPPPAGR